MLEEFKRDLPDVPLVLFSTEWVRLSEKDAQTATFNLGMSGVYHVEFRDTTELKEWFDSIEAQGFKYMGWQHGIKSTMLYARQ